MYIIVREIVLEDTLFEMQDKFIYNFCGTKVSYGEKYNGLAKRKVLSTFVTSPQEFPETMSNCIKLTNSSYFICSIFFGATT